MRKSSILDDLHFIKSIDQSGVLESINKLADQCEQAWNESRKINIPQNFYNIHNIVVSGMGGSSYGVRIIKALYDGAQICKTPIELSNNYWLPGYVDKNSLVILSSYSGATQEILATTHQALKLKAKIIGITSGGLLADLLKSNNCPSYIFNPIHNPSQQPRVGVGYMVMGLIGILAKLQKIPVSKLEIEEIIASLQHKSSVLCPNSTLANNPAKRLALKLRDKIPIIMVADFLEGAAYAVRNPIHETAKQFALYFATPELNHHLLEGLKFPNRMKDLIIFIFVISSIYDRRNSKRLELTKEIVIKNSFAVETLVLSNNSGLGQVFEFIQFGAWLSFYLAMLNKVDPVKIPWVDYFKNKLKGESS